MPEEVGEKCGEGGEIEEETNDATPVRRVSLVHSFFDLFCRQIVLRRFHIAKLFNSAATKGGTKRQRRR